ncbi:MAG: type 2 isopentenyl-diphosphate Delta-isomerase [Methanosarcinales archaeon]|nr:MAG: type 2 isopentenyl-diphosphate Delta-isomerase [Methanosarcinales archaeon]
MNTSIRKIEHLKLCAEEDVEARKNTMFSLAGFGDIHLVHQALPEINKKDIDTSTRFFNRRFSAPIMIASMTGGHPDTFEINHRLALAAAELNVGIGVGSQRAAIEDPKQESSFKIVRDAAPDVFVQANIGAVQLTKYGVRMAQKVVDMIDADALSIHLNFLQEAIQPEGDTDATGCLTAIRKVCSELSIPVIVKETGAGISYETASALVDAGVSAIDVGGMGGTSWAGVEAYRAKDRGDVMSEHLGNVFWNWGIPTAASIIECRGRVPVIATGGVRNGIDVLKSLGLGANLCGIALPLLKPAMKSKNHVIEILVQVIEELKVAMFLCGCADIRSVKNIPVIVTGNTRQWLEGKDFDIK